MRACVLLLLGTSSSYFTEYCSNSSADTCCHSFGFRCPFSSPSLDPISMPTTCSQHDPHFHLSPSLTTRRCCTSPVTSYASAEPTLLLTLTSSLCRSASSLLQLNVLLDSHIAIISRSGTVSTFCNPSAPTHSPWYRASPSSLSIVLSSFLSIVRREMNCFYRRMAEFDSSMKQAACSTKPMKMTYTTFTEAIANDLDRMGHVCAITRSVMAAGRVNSFPFRRIAFKYFST